MYISCSVPTTDLRNYSPTNLHGLPCPVWRVQRLEKQWYSVTFYTNEGWGFPVEVSDRSRYSSKPSFL